jgi:hypothetical protein
MDIKKSIADLALKRGRAVAKSDAIYESKREASDAESSASKAKNSKDFDKFKKECLTRVDAGEKGTKAWQSEMDDWDGGIKDLEKEIAAEKEKIAQQQKEDEAVSKAIEEINADIKAYNDSLLLGEHDPRYRPLFAKRNIGAKLASAAAALTEADALAKSERTTWSNQKTWVSKPIEEMKAIKARVSKSKFSPPK